MTLYQHTIGYAVDSIFLPHGTTKKLKQRSQTSLPMSNVISGLKAI